MKKRLLLFYVGPLALWMVIIFAMSTGAGTAEQSTGLIAGILRRLSPSFLASLSVYQLDRLDYAARKLGHVTEYMVLTMLAVRALQFGRPAMRWQSLAGALLLSVLYAASDEIHQWFVPNRTSTLRDVLIDVSGSVLCMVLIVAWFALKRLERHLWSRAEVSATVNSRQGDGTLDPT